MTSPFGIPLYSAVSDLGILAELDGLKYHVQPIVKHPDFDGYIVQATLALGIVWLKAIGSPIENDDFGANTRVAVDRTTISCLNATARLN